MATATTAPARAKLNDIAINKVLRIEAGLFSVNARVRDASGNEVGDFEVNFRNGECQGIRFAADGSIQGFTDTVADGFTKALAEFFKPGTLLGRSLAVEAYAIAQGLLPS